MAANGDVRQRRANETPSKAINGVINQSKKQAGMASESSATWVTTAICVSGIYGAFLTWGVLQEKITTTNYGTESQQEKFTYSIVMNAVQAFFAAILGYFYTLFTRTSPSDKPIFPSTTILGPLILVASTSSLSSPFGYASLAYVDYITFILAKSCKLLPVMFLHVTLYRRKYPFYKYAVVALVTVGVAIFTLHQPSSGKKKGSQSGNSAYGLTLLAINLLLDGLTNSTQDDINAKFKPFSGQQMMCALNIMQTLLMTAFLFLAPYIAQSPLGAYVDIPIQLEPALQFMQKHPSVVYDILGFAAAGAIGQLFIFYTLSIFGSLFLVTVTVTRKMLTMMISVVWFGHMLTSMQWLGVGCVFGGIIIEGQLGKREKAAKAMKLQAESEKRKA